MTARSAPIAIPSTGEAGAEDVDRQIEDGQMLDPNVLETVAELQDA